MIPIIWYHKPHNFRRTWWEGSKLMGHPKRKLKSKRKGPWVIGEVKRRL